LLRLTGAATTPGVTHGYGYDLAGNRTTVTRDGLPAEPTRVYDAAHQVQGWAYDAAGNLTNNGTLAYTYDALHRVRTASGLGAGQTYQSNGDGVLVQDSVRTYTYDLAAPLPQRLSWDGPLSGETAVYGVGAAPVRIADNDGTAWLLPDGLGSVRGRVNDAGIPQITPGPGGISVGEPRIMAYDPWGTPEAGTLGEMSFGFTGEPQDATLGLVTLRARWYNTRHGTLTSVDPFAGFAEQPYSQHPYQYAYSNPVVWTDPSGQVSIVDGGGGPRCIPIVERWDPFLQACVPNLGPPPPNNRLTNDAARSYAQAFEDLVGAPTADAGGILTTDVAIPYPGIGGFPRVGLPRIGLTLAQQRAALPAALAALGCPLLTGDQADVRTRTNRPRIGWGTVGLRYGSRTVNRIIREYDVIPYNYARYASPGLFNMHHGVMSAWVSQHVPGYDENQAPTIALSVASHRATVAEYNRWKSQNYPRTPVPWATMDRREALLLSVRLFNAANVPNQARATYYRAFKLYESTYGIIDDDAWKTWGLNRRGD
jgi:RHS repeat-associated protein